MTAETASTTSLFRELNQIVDLEKYPLHLANSDRWQQVVAQIRADMHRDGCSVLPGFIKQQTLTQLENDCAALAPLAYYQSERVNVYNTDPESQMDVGHPANITFQRGNAFVARDQIPDESIVSRLYGNDAFKTFLASCFATQKLHELADPLAALCINVLQPGQEHPWHFDINEFTVSLLTSRAEHGGDFEFCPHIRSPENENLTQVSDVLRGAADVPIRRLDLRCGDLQLFAGRFALHRVSKVTGKRPRHTAIFAYSKLPNVVGGVARTRQLFGRVLPAHVAAQQAPTRSDNLLD